MRQSLVQSGFTDLKSNWTSRLHGLLVCLSTCHAADLSSITDNVFNTDIIHITNGPRQANLVLIAYASSEGSGEPAHPRSLARTCASAQSRQNLRCSLIQAVNQEEPSDRKPDPWPLWMAGHAQLKFVMTECSKTQIRLTGLKYILMKPKA